MVSLSRLGHNFVVHQSYYVRHGKMPTALVFFKELGWQEIRDSHLARGLDDQHFLVSHYGGPVFCLDELSTQEDALFSGKRPITIFFHNLSGIFDILRQWAEEHHVSDGFKITGEGPWRVEIPALFAFPLVIS